MAPAAVAIMSSACSLVSKPLVASCPNVVGWPASVPAPPDGVVIDHPGGTVVRVTNGTGAPINVRFTTLTPADCVVTPIAGLDSLLAPGKLAEWSGDVPNAARGPVLGGIEVWTRGCGVACVDPPDAFVSFEIAGGP
jgi:hypothetical protein